MGKALVTGGSRGIGAAICRSLLAAGFEVHAPTRDELDLSADASVRSFCANRASDYDVLVNNAGINPVMTLEEMRPDDLREVLEVNLVSPIMLARFCADGMAERGYGRIVNISSIWGRVSKSGRGAYSAAKAGLIGVTRTMAIELGPRGVLVNSVAPGFVKTELTIRNNSDAELAGIASLLPLRRLAEPEEIAELVLFLCSRRNSFITGQTIFADGGFSCQ